MRTLGIDFGLKKVGLAFAESGLAEPLLVMDYSDRLVNKIDLLVKEYSVEKIVLGLPEGKLVSRVKNFAQELASMTSLPVVFQDETLTSQDAIAKMIEAGKRKKFRREKQDVIAAALILQAYLDSNV